MVRLWHQLVTAIAYSRGRRADELSVELVIDLVS